MTNSTIIADTSGLISLITPHDSNHSKAKEISKEIHNLIIPGEIITETINVLGRKESHQKAIEVAEWLFSESAYNIVEMTEVIRLNALEIFKTQAESVSYTDCIVMAIADSFNTRDIFGFDQAFRKNGYSLIEAPRAA